MNASPRSTLRSGPDEGWECLPNLLLVIVRSCFAITFTSKGRGGGFRRTVNVSKSTIRKKLKIQILVDLVVVVVSQVVMVVVGWVVQQVQNPNLF